MVVFALKPSKVWSTAAFAALLTCLGGYNISSAYGKEVSVASALQGGFVSSMALGATPKYAKDSPILVTPTRKQGQEASYASQRWAVSISSTHLP